MATLKTLPLRYRTPAHWASQVLKEPLSLLSDQAYLEKKAANNALEFLNLWPANHAPAHWLSSVAAIAKDETLHLQLVLKLLEKGAAPSPIPIRTLTPATFGKGSARGRVTRTWWTGSCYPRSSRPVPANGSNGWPKRPTMNFRSFTRA